MEWLRVSRIDLKRQGKKDEDRLARNVQYPSGLCALSVLCPVQLLRAGVLLCAGWLLRLRLLLHAFGLRHAGCLLRPDASEGGVRDFR